MNTDGQKSRSADASSLFCWIIGSSGEMKLIFGLMLLKTAACLEFNCSFQSDLCRAALGHKLSLLMVDASTYKLKIQKTINNNSDDPVCGIKNDRIKENECDLFNNRAEVSVINGTLIINSVIRSDSGNYRLYLYLSDGTETFRDLQVIVEVPTVAPIVLGCLAVILISLVIMAFYVYKKKNGLKPTTNLESDGPEPVNEHDAQKRLALPGSPSERLVIVRILRQRHTHVEYTTIDSQGKRKNKRTRKEDEVHYGEVTFTNSRVQQSSHTLENCVYSEVHTR